MGAPKAFVELQGRPLVAHVLDRLTPGVARVYLNAAEDSGRWRALGHPLVFDPPRWRGQGPLAGILAALSRARADGFAWLATAPCDAPFLALDLVERLTAAAAASGAAAAVAITASGVEPMFALWPVSAAGRVEAALAAGRAGPRGLLLELGAATAAFDSETEAAAFANLNTPEDLAEAAGRNDQTRV
jgi:molybdopterin-guanine dinucleotide biosynthesis protein A